MTSKSVLVLLLAIAGPRQAATAEAPAAPLRILFIGNSYTSVNDLPGTFRKAAESAGRPAPAVESVTPGGQTLEGHLSDPKVTAKIAGGCGPERRPWDVVVLQEQSQRPALAEEDAAHRKAFVDAAAALRGRIRAAWPEARVILYETWARHADQWKDARAVRGLGKDPAEMQSRIRKWYRRAAGAEAPGPGPAGKSPPAEVAPVGDAWEAWGRRPGAARLHADDGSHPNVRGTYLAALVLVAVVYGTDPVDVRFRGALAPEEAAGLRSAAAEAIRPRRPAEEERAPAPGGR